MESHISRDEMVRVFSWEATESEIHIGLAHIGACRQCWTLASEVVAALKRTDDLVPRRRGRPPEWRYSDARDALLVLMEIQEQRSLGWLRAKGWWAELKELSPKEQADKVTSVAAVHRREVFETILREAKLVCGSDPYAGEHLAMTAHLLVDHLPADREFPSHVKDSLRVSAMTVVANSRRLGGDWQGSLSAVNSAQRFLLTKKIEPSAEAYLLSVHASLVGDTGQLEGAVLLESKAADIYRGVGDLKGLATLKIQTADTLQRTSRPRDAIVMAEDALALLMPESVRLAMLARSIITENLIALGRTREALMSYQATKPLYDELRDEVTFLKAEYLEAKILDAFGYPRESEKLFRSAIGGMTEMENHRLSVLFMYAFFESLFKRGALGKAARLCQDGIDLLEATDRVHPQMCQVWRDLLAAVQAQALQESHLVEMKEYLTRHWALPASRAPFS